MSGAVDTRSWLAAQQRELMQFQMQAKRTSSDAVERTAEEQLMLELKRTQQRLNDIKKTLKAKYPRLHAELRICDCDHI